MENQKTELRDIESGYWKYIVYESPDKDLYIDVLYNKDLYTGIIYNPLNFSDAKYNPLNFLMIGC
ncbi:hypothetical protein NZD88_05460 [Chryseobacterium antibioticum]|uniref:Uncharacterized protein n=1 Tax=Chryseobacterium pyrolae TaxID=2987481 RepID=A0ABT2IEH7_9FLAO|nr:hypothetical protein [Chryseobacterium pyrolae]MCT2407001.1 hypothetical protein [Chryseobacterium pyrolae]